MNELQHDLERFENEMPATNQRALVEERKTRASSEIQSALVIAQRFPRDELKVEQKIMTACKRYSLAEMSMYAFPRGGKVVKGPSIRLAETLVRLWGNCKYGFSEIESGQSSSTVEAFCWDLEGNLVVTRTFTVEHIVPEKDKRQKTRLSDGRFALTDSRDRYENMANHSTRRMRACMLEVIPGEIVDNAEKECQATLERGPSASEPLPDRIKKMAMAFVDIGVSKEMLEKRLGHTLDITIPKEMADLQAIYRSIKENITDRRAWFEFGDQAPVDGGKASTLQERLNKGKEPKEQQMEAKADVKAVKKPDPEKTAKAADDGPEAQEGEFANYDGGSVLNKKSEIDQRGK